MRLKNISYERFVVWSLGLLVALCEYLFIYMWAARHLLYETQERNSVACFGKYFVEVFSLKIRPHDWLKP